MLLHRPPTTTAPRPNGVYCNKTHVKTNRWFARQTTAAQNNSAHPVYGRCTKQRINKFPMFDWLWPTPTKPEPEPEPETRVQTTSVVTMPMQIPKRGGRRACVTRPRTASSVDSDFQTVDELDLIVEASNTLQAERARSWSGRSTHNNGSDFTRKPRTKSPKLDAPRPRTHNRTKVRE